MSVIINGTDGVTFNDSSLQGAAASPFALKNRIINGDMRIDQRNAGASVATTNVSDQVYTIDRWYYRNLVASKYTIQQNAASVTPPTGFTNYLGCTSTSAYTVGASEFFSISQNIEGFNVSDLDFGKATAKTITLSFWVRSSLTGTFGGVVANAGFSRCYPFSYTISSANTWEFKTVTIAGDTSGTWLTTNGSGLTLRFSLGAGSTYSGTAGAWTSSAVVSSTGATSVVGTNGATLYITGVQLEVGSTSTPFERRLYGNELALCQRYFYSYNAGGEFNVEGYARQQLFVTSSTGAKWYPQYPVPMRTCPTVSSANIASSAVSIYNFSTPADVAPTSLTAAEGTIIAGQLQFNVASGFSLGNTVTWRWQGVNVGTYIWFNAEL